MKKLSIITTTAAVCSAFTIMATSVDAASLIYTLSGSNITGSLGATGFTNASWSMTMTADSADVVSGTFVGGGIYQFPYYYLAGSPIVSINTGDSTLTATLVPATIGNTVGILSMANPFNSDVRNQFIERNINNTSPPLDSLGVMSNTLNSLDTEGSFGTNQYKNATAKFNTSVGELKLTFHNNISGSFTIAAVPEPTSALMSALGATMLLRRRRK